MKNYDDDKNMILFAVLCIAVLVIVVSPAFVGR